MSIELNLPEPTTGAFTVLTPLTETAETVLDPAPPIPLPVEIGLAPCSEHNLYAGFDGIEGVFVATYDAVTVGTPVDLTLCLPGGAVVEAHGRVELVRSPCSDASPGVFVRIEGLNEPDARTLATFAELREPLFHC